MLHPFYPPLVDRTHEGLKAEHPQVRWQWQDIEEVPPPGVEVEVAEASVCCRQPDAVDQRSLVLSQATGVRFAQDSHKNQGPTPN